MSQKDRRDARCKALIRARMRGGSGSDDVCILDVSAGGLLATCADPPVRGTFVELLAGRYPLVGHVEWAKGRRFGVSLRERIDVPALLRGDGPDITLRARGKAQAAAARAAAPWFGGSRGVARAAQFALLVSAGVFAAFTLSHYVGRSLRVLGTAQAAMAGSR